MRKILFLYDGDAATADFFELPEGEYLCVRMRPESFSRCAARDMDAILIYGDDAQYLEQEIGKIRLLEKSLPVVIVTSQRAIVKLLRYQVVINDVIVITDRETGLAERIARCIDDASMMYLRYYQYANILRMSGRTKKAVEAYKSAMELKPDFLPVYTDLAGLYFRGGDYRDAKKVIRSSKLYYQDVPELLRLKARIAFKEGNLEKAERVYGKCVKYSPFSLMLLVEYFFILVRRGKFADAVKSAFRGLPQLLEMREKTRHYLRITERGGDAEEIRRSAGLALLYFPDDTEFKALYERHDINVASGEKN